MRAGIAVTVTPEDRRRLDAIVRDRNRPQKHVARAQVLIATAAEHNQDPRPFTWTADPQRVLAAVSRGNQALESIH
jgi:hypothetical protein